MNYEYNKSPNRTSVEAQTYTLLAPVDWGVAFSLANIGKLFLLAIIPIMVELAANYVLYSHRLLRQHILLLIVATMIANVWLAASTFMLCIEECLEREIDLNQIALQAVVNLPKIFASYLLTIIVIVAGLGSFIVPGLFFMGFLLWAPAFCVGELFAEQRKDKIDDKESPGDDDEEEFASLLQRRRSYFTDKSLWELGFSRSARLSGGSYRHAMQVALILIALNLVPNAVVDLVWGYSFSFVPQALKIVASSLCGALALGVWAGTFITLLPFEAKAELGLGSYPDPIKTLGDKIINLPSIDSRLGPHIVLVILTVLGVWNFFEQARSHTLIPEDVTIDVNLAQAKEGELVLETELTDRTADFRWLVPENFEVSFATVDTEGDVKGVDEKGRDKGGLFTETKKAKENFFAPNKVEVHSLSGKFVASDAVSPYYEPLKIKLTYALPADVKEKQEGQFALAYVSPLAAPNIRYRGRYHDVDAQAIGLPKPD